MTFNIPGAVGLLAAANIVIGILLLKETVIFIICLRQKQSFCRQLLNIIRHYQKN